MVLALHFWAILCLVCTHLRRDLILRRHLLISCVLLTGQCSLTTDCAVIGISGRHPWWTMNEPSYTLKDFVKLLHYYVVLARYISINFLLSWGSIYNFIYIPCLLQNILFICILYNHLFLTYYFILFSLSLYSFFCCISFYGNLYFMYCELLADAVFLWIRFSVGVVSVEFHAERKFDIDWTFLVMQMFFVYISSCFDDFSNAIQHEMPVYSSLNIWFVYLI